jgi:toxin ParE1/3/4
MNVAAKYRIIFSNQVADDLQSIFDYIAARSPENARRFVTRILNEIERLTIFPHRNVVKCQRHDPAHPLRSLPVRSYMVYFRVFEEDHTVRLVRVQHGARRRPKRFD